MFPIASDRLHELSAKVPWWWSCRLTLGLIASLGFINVYAMRVNISIGIVCMVNHTALCELGTVHAAPPNGSFMNLQTTNPPTTGFSVSDASSPNLAGNETYNVTNTGVIVSNGSKSAPCKSVVKTMRVRD